MTILGVTASSILKINGAYESIASAVGDGTSTSVTFSSIPNTYAHLQVRISALFAGSGNGISIRPNSSTATNYTRHRMASNGSALSASGNASPDGLTGADVFGYTVGGRTTQPSVAIIDLHNYASTTEYKTIRSFSGCDFNGNGEIDIFSSLWVQTTAISSLQIYSGAAFSTGTTFSLYGIKGS